MQWRDIQGFEGLYQVSDTGLVKSLCRHVSNGSAKGMMLPERILKAEKLQSGYLCVSLRKDGKTYTRYVHRLVASAFLNGSGECVNHIDGNK